MKKLLIALSLAFVLFSCNNGGTDSKNPLIGTWLSESLVDNPDVPVGSIYSKYTFNQDETFEWEYKEKPREILLGGQPWVNQLFLNGTYKDKNESFQLYGEKIKEDFIVDYHIDNNGNLVVYNGRLRCSFPHAKIN
jgi:hypothetical protein